MSAKLSSWDFLQDLDFGFDLYRDNNASCQAAVPEATSHEHQKELNRKAQQRTRQKKKVVKIFFSCQSSMHSWLMSNDVPGTLTKHRGSAS